MTNYEKIVNSTQKELEDAIISRCGKACPFFNDCHVTSTYECRRMVREWLAEEFISETEEGKNG